MYPISLLTDLPEPTYPEYGALLAAVRRTSQRFVDPANLYPEAPAVARRGGDWATAVLGRPYNSAGRISLTEQMLLIAADAADIDPPLPDWIIQGRRVAEERDRQRDRRRDQAHQRDLDAWTTALTAATVDLDVYANPTARPRNGYTHHLGHAVPRADVYSGDRRIRTHPAGRALCESPTRAQPLALQGQPEPDGTPATCRSCLTWAPQVRANTEIGGVRA